MKKSVREQMQNRYKNEGFSLIEVLVSITLVALICVPLFSGFQLSAILNNRAHFTQKVTAYAQEELETIRSYSVESYVAQFNPGKTEDGVTYSYIDSAGADSDFGEWEDMNNDAQNELSGLPVTPTAEQVEALFKPFICEKRNVSIGGKAYILRTKFMPAAYSKYSVGTEKASDVNVAGYYDVAQADAVRFPVVSNEINTYDDVCADALLEKLEGIGVTGLTSDLILGNMKKRIDVEIESSVGAAEVAVRCDVTYSYPADTPQAEVSYGVYSSSYEIYPTAPAAGRRIGDESGGNVFIMAKAFRKSSADASVNELHIVCSGDADTNVYFILGRENGNSHVYNFKEVTVNGTSYISGYSIAHNALVEKPGEMVISGTNGKFRTNIKLNGTEMDIGNETVEKMLDSIGVESYKADTVTYAVEIDVYEAENTNKKVAHIETTKVNR